MNYKTLLIKYIKHVQYEEGVTFLSESDIKHSSIVFSEEEKEILKDFYIDIDNNIV